MTTTLAPTPRNGFSEPSLLRVRALHEEAHTVEDIARRQGATPEHIGRLLAVTDDDLTRLYSSGQTIQEIAAHLDVTPYSIHRALQEAGAALRPSGRRNPPQKTVERVVRLYQEGMSIRRAAKQAGISHNVCHGILKAQRVPRRSNSRYPLLTADEKTAILTAHDAGRTVLEIAAALNRSDTPIRRFLRAHGKTPNRSRRSRATPSFDLDHAARLYQEGMSLIAVGAQFAVSGENIRFHFRKAGIAIRPRGAARGPDPAKRQEIIDAYQAGEPIGGIIARLRIARTTIHTTVAAAGIPTRPPRRERVSVDVDEAIRLYAEGLNLRRVAARLGVSYDVLRRRFRTAGVACRGGGKRFSDPVKRQQALDAYRAGHTTRSIATQLRLSNSTIKRILREAQEPVNRSHGRSRTVAHADVAAAYRAGRTLRQVAAQFGVSTDTVRLHLDRAGVPRCPRRPSPGPAERQQIADAYKAGDKIIDIQSRFHVKATTILRIADAAGVPRRRPQRLHRARQ